MNNGVCVFCCVNGDCFCRACIMNWAEIGDRKCPLCKAKFTFVLYDVKSDHGTVLSRQSVGDESLLC